MVQILTGPDLKTSKISSNWSRSTELVQVLTGPDLKSWKIKNMWAAAAAQIEKCTTVLLCFCFAFALLLLCFAFALLTHILICLLHTHIFIRLLLYRHIFICPLLFIENSLAKDEVASMIPCPMKAQISKSKPGRISTDQQMQARLQQGTNFVRPWMGGSQPWGSPNGYAPQLTSHPHHTKCATSC